MKKIIFTTIAIMILLLVSSAYGEDYGIIKGTVVDTTFRPVYKAQIVVDRSPMAESDKNGVFYIDAVPEGKHMITIEKEGWEFPEQMVFIKKDSSVKDLTIQGSLSDWAVALITYVFVVILALIAIANFLLVIDYFAMPKPTGLFITLSIIIALIAIAMSFAKLELTQAALFTALTLLSMAIIMKKGKVCVAKRLQEHMEREKEQELKALEKKDPFKELISLEGAAITDLSLYGKVEIDNKIYEAKSRKDYIKRGQQICVLSTEGNTLVVEQGSYRQYS